MAASQPVSSPRLFVVMGVSGCGKTTVGEAVAVAIQGTFLDGDTFHSKGSIAKMESGEPLTDADRWPWLDRVAGEMAARSGIVIGGCSALRKIYRDRLRSAAGEPLGFVYLHGTEALIAGRMSERSGHFMPLSLLKSQFATLEEPDAEDLTLRVEIDAELEVITREISQWINAIRT